LTCEKLCFDPGRRQHRTPPEEKPMSIADNAVDPTTDPSGRYAPADSDLPEPPELDADSDEDDQSAQAEPDEMELPS
jgi:hypothetical protein